ncbi:MAG: ABC transporter ATP-binding protein [Opitutales bacterium]
MAKVTFKSLKKIYDQGQRTAFTAVKGIDLEIRDGEFMVLVGPSGCGKSTTLRMVAGLESITGGELRIGERVVNTVQPKNRDIAMVFQNYALYPHMTVYENMAFGLRLRKYTREVIHERVTEAAEVLGIDALLGRKPKALSGGQRQRVALGRAIVRKPEVFLFDEPLSNLDAKMRVSMRSEISRLHQRLKSTMIYVTHDQTEAMTMGDRICVMKDGHIQQVDQPVQLYEAPANRFVAGFIGSPAMNFFEGCLEAASDDLRFVEQSASKGQGFQVVLPAEQAESLRDYAGKPVILGIRPEAITEAAEVAGRSALRATVRIAEPMGAETYLHLETGQHRFVARVAGSRKYACDAPIELTIDRAQIHFFDPESEAALT